MKTPKQIPANEIQFPVAENNENRTAENLSQIVGREKEISQIRNLLAQRDARLVTLAGVGGTGKTRLAQTLAQGLAANFADGVFFVELAAITNPELVAPTIAKTLGIKEAGDKPVSESLKNFLRDKQMMLVIDTFEQVIDAAPIIAELISSAENLKILITSRTLLNLSAERKFIVPPLDLPNGNSNVSPDELSKYEAIELFVERARNVNSNFALTKENADAVAEVCRRLDGLPLAIELAAARIKILSPSAILERLENQLNLLTGGASDLPERQQTMRGTIRWSYDLLDEDKKILFQKLSVFAGSFTIEASESVVYEEVDSKKTVKIKVPSIFVLDGITSLTDKNLLVSKKQTNGDVRFRMLEVVREFALESLEAGGELEEIRRRHAEYFLELGETAEPFLYTDKSAEWLNRLEQEHDKLRSALNWAMRHNVNLGQRLIGAIWRSWWLHGHIREACERLGAFLSQTDAADKKARTKMLLGAGFLNRLSGNFELSASFAAEALVLARETGDAKNSAFALYLLGILALDDEDFTRAEQSFEKGLVFAKNSGDVQILGVLLNGLGEFARMRQNYEQAASFYRQALEINRKIGDAARQTTNLINLGATYLVQKDFENAGKFYREALEVSSLSADMNGTLYCLEGVAGAYWAIQKPEQAALLFGAVSALRQLNNLLIETPDLPLYEQSVALVRDFLSEKQFDELYAEGQKINLEEAVRLCLEKNDDEIWGENIKNPFGNSITSSPFIRR